MVSIKPTRTSIGYMMDFILRNSKYEFDYSWIVIHTLSLEIGFRNLVLVRSSGKHKLYSEWQSVIPHGRTIFKRRSSFEN